MPTRGSALVGFMDRDRAIQFLQEACVPPDPTEAVLEAIWDGARRTIGTPTPNAGQANLLNLPADHAAYEQALRNGPWKPTFEANPGWEIKLIEIAPLLAYQHHVDIDRSDHHCGVLPDQPTIGDMLPIALPQGPQPETAQVAMSPQSVIIKSKGFNLRVQRAGLIDNWFMGMNFGFALPFVHVVRFEGRLYLHNGYHRAFGALKAGATHIPAVFRDVVDVNELGVREDGATFGIDLLRSAHPPTVANFAGPGSAAVAMRAMTRILHVSWAEYGIPDE